jgi:cytochrome P450
MRAMEVRVTELARHYVDRMAQAGGECDFATQIAAHYPLYVILSLLGLPESDVPRLLKLTQELFGGADAERRRGATPEEQMAALLDFFAYFQNLTAARRAEPTGDLASAIANARVDGEYLSDFDTASYYVIIATAGHDTTSSTISGGLHALIEHPGELARLRDDPALLPTAADEMIRWVTPVKEFMRTAAADTQVGGVPVKEGESLLLSYPSANRDEEVFDDPFGFRIDRRPNPQLSFGFAEHFCMGAHLARLEMETVFRHLLDRLESFEVAGPPQRLNSAVNGGIKHLPVRWRLA